MSSNAYMIPSSHDDSSRRNSATLPLILNTDRPETPRVHPIQEDDGVPRRWFVLSIQDNAERRNSPVRNNPNFFTKISKNFIGSLRRLHSFIKEKWLSLRNKFLEKYKSVRARIESFRPISQRKWVLMWLYNFTSLMFSIWIVSATCTSQSSTIPIECVIPLTNIGGTLVFCIFIYFFFKVGAFTETETPLLPIPEFAHPQKDVNFFAKTMDEWVLHTWSASVNWDTLKGPSDISCLICYEPLKTNEWVRILPCAHLYHHNCIQDWSITNLFRKNSVCPHCKYNIRHTLLDEEPASNLYEVLERKDVKEIQEDPYEDSEYQINYDRVANYADNSAREMREDRLSSSAGRSTSRSGRSNRNNTRRMSRGSTSSHASFNTPNSISSNSSASVVSSDSVSSFTPLISPEERRPLLNPLPGAV